MRNKANEHRTNTKNITREASTLSALKTNHENDLNHTIHNYQANNSPTQDYRSTGNSISDIARKLDICSIATGNSSSSSNEDKIK